MRIGIRLDRDTISGAAFDSGLEPVRATSELSSERSLLGLLRQLTGPAPPSPDAHVSVAFDLDAVLTRRALSPPEEDGRGSVLLLVVAPRPPTQSALLRHPDPLVDRHLRTVLPVRGGHTLTGRELAPLDEPAVQHIARRMAAGEFGDVRDVAVVATGALTSPEHELRVAEAFLSAVDGVRVSVSRDFGGAGFTERTCSTVLNAVLTRDVDPLVTWCETATRTVLGGVPLGFARGDGGRLLASRMRTYPVAALRATTACTLSGAARATDLTDCGVLLVDDGRLCRGEVVEGLPVALPERQLVPGTRLSLPTPKLGELPGSLLGGTSDEDERVHVLADDPDDPADSATLSSLGQGAERMPRVDARLAGLRGLAFCEPMAFIDEIAAVGDADGVRRAQADAEQRALAMAVSAGGTPGTERIVESSVLQIPYGGTATVRLRVRSTCSLSGDRE